MDNEIIILSSDEEKEDNTTKQTVQKKTNPSNNDIDFFKKALSNYPCSSGSTKNKYPPYKLQLICNSKSKDKIVVKEIANENSNRTNDSSPELVDLVEVSPKKIDKPLYNDELQKESQNKGKSTVSSSSENSNKLTTSAALQNNETKSNFRENVKSSIYDEFVLKCGSLEKIEEDKERLVKKLYKYYSKCNQEYVKSEKFLLLVEKNMKKLNEQNLYLIAKEVTDELCLQREVEIRKVWFVQGKHSSESDNDKNNKLNLRQSKVVNRILYKLTKLQRKIQELEETEVDLSDEEDSVYVKLQSYRNKFCQIYKRLCKYTNQIADANRMYSRNISFTGSPYTEINQCIEKWLNKTKRFPDFKDILKLIENQSSSLGLSSDRESIREIAKEIFQKVGIQLKERRKYDLWDSFCGYLKDSEDPAKNDPELEKILNNNALIAIKKEQEVIKHYAQVQEKEKLEPEEISDGEANQSPLESGNEDENEIEAIESSIDQKLYNDIERELQDGLIQINDDDDDQLYSDQQKQEEEEEKSLKLRESKNGYKNCKSLKWRKLSGGNSISSLKVNEIGPSNSSTNDETHFDTDESVNSRKSFSSKTATCKSSLIDYTKNPVIQLKRLPQNVIEAYCKRKQETVDTGKRIINPYFVPSADEVPPKKSKPAVSDNELMDIENDLKKKKYESPNFTVRHCHIEHSFRNILNTLGYFDDFLSDQKDFNSRKIFRDLTNTNKLFHSSGRRKRTGCTSSPTIYKCTIDSFREPLWKKRFKVFNSFSNSNTREQRCALSHEEKTQTSVKGGGGTNKDFQNNSGSGERGNCNFRSDRGSGSERDNNENDENKRNYKTEDDDPDENKYEDEEEKDDENEDGEEEEEESDRFKSQSEEKVSNEENQNTGTLNCERLEENNESGMEKRKSDCSQNSAVRTEKESEEKDRVEEKEKSAVEENIGNIEKSDWAEDNMLEPNSPRDEGNDGEISFADGESEKKITETDETLEGDKPNYGNEVAEEKIIENKEDCKTKENECEQETLKEKETNTNQVMKVEVESSVENLMAPENNCEKTDEKKPDVGVENESGVQAKRRRRSKINTSKGNLSESTEENKRVTRLTRNKNREKKTETKNERFNYYNNTSSRNYEALITAEATIGEQVVQAQVTLEEKSSNCHRITNSQRCRRPPENFFSKKLDVETLRQNLCKRKSTNSTPSPSDEERVKRFLLHSPSSISITPPKKLSLSKPPSQAALQALATLRNLKGISTTRVRTKPKTEEDVVVLGESSRRGAASSAQPAKKSANGVKTPKTKTNSFPVIPDIQSMLSVTPKIVEVQGSVRGFENAPQKRGPRNKNRKASSNSNSRSSSGSGGGTSSSIKISNVWGALPNSFVQSSATPQNKAIPSCSYPQARNPTTNKATNKKKNSKKVEYVELD